MTHKGDGWYPLQEDDGLWYAHHRPEGRINIGFPSAGACMAYLVRADLIPRGDLNVSAASERLTILSSGSDGPPDDDRFEWVDTSTMAEPDQWIRGRCNHMVPEPVDAYPTGELVAWLCPDCGGQFPAERWPVPEGMWRRIPDLFTDDTPVPRTQPTVVRSPFITWLPILPALILVVGMVVIGLANGWS